MLPDDMQEYYKCYFGGEEDSEALKLVKAADKLSALVNVLKRRKQVIKNLYVQRSLL